MNLERRIERLEGRLPDRGEDVAVLAMMGYDPELDDFRELTSEEKREAQDRERRGEAIIIREYIDE